MTELHDDTVVGQFDCGSCAAANGTDHRGVCICDDVKLSDLTPEIQALIRAGLAAKALVRGVEAELWSHQYAEDGVEGIYKALAAYQAAIGGDE